MRKNKTLSVVNIRLNYIKLLAIISFILVFFSIYPVTHASGASLYLSPSSSSYKIGQSFTVNVFVSL